jgi:prophage regulatory protein
MRHKEERMEVDKPLQIMREPERLAITGLSRVHWWRMERQGIVPARVKLGPNSVGWLRHEISAWVERKANERNSNSGGDRAA